MRPIGRVSEAGTRSDRVWEEGEEVREAWALIMKWWRVGISAALLLVIEED